MAPLPEHYEVLGVGREAAAPELRAAYLRRVLETHPDKGGSSAEFSKVMTAFTTLIDPTSRKAYDASLMPGMDAKGSGNGVSADCCKRRRRPRTSVPDPGSTSFDATCLEAVWRLLQQMSPECRRSGIQCLPETARAALEDWMRARTQQGCTSTAPLQRSSPEVQDDASGPSSSSSSSEGEEGAAPAGQQWPSPRKPRVLRLPGPEATADESTLSPGRGVLRSFRVAKSGEETVWYHAGVGFRHQNLYMWVMARKRRDLSRAVTDHIVLTKVLELLRADAGPRQPYETRLEEAVLKVLGEHGLSPGEGPRLCGASSALEPDCLFLRYTLFLCLDYRFNTSLKCPTFTDLASAVQALRRLRLARGQCRRFRGLPYPQLLAAFERVNAAIAAIHAEAQPGSAEAVERRLRGQEDDFMAMRDEVLLRRLRRTVSAISQRQRKRQRREERRRAAEERQVRLRSRRELLRWDPNETWDERERRLARLGGAGPAC